MSREIDLDNLDIDDVRYMRDRPSLIQEALLQGVDDIEERLSEVEQADATAPVDYVNDFKLDELRTLADQRGVSHLGTKKQIAARLTAQDNGEDTAVEHSTSQTPSTTDGAPVVGETEVAPTGAVGETAANDAGQGAGTESGE